jgi:hypothetical protein
VQDHCSKSAADAQPAEDKVRQMVLRFTPSRAAGTSLSKAGMFTAAPLKIRAPV